MAEPKLARVTERTLDLLRKQPDRDFSARELAAMLGNVSSRSIAVGLNFAVRDKVSVLLDGHRPFRYRIRP